MTTIDMSADEHNTRAACRYANETQAGGTVTIECVRCGFTRSAGTWGEAYAAYLGEDVWKTTGYLPMVKS